MPSYPLVQRVQHVILEQTSEVLLPQPELGEGRELGRRNRRSCHIRWSPMGFTEMGSPTLGKREDVQGAPPA